MKVCPICFKEQCNCNSNKIDMDKLIIPIIYILNKKNYKTISSCSGHDDTHEHNKTYIEFDQEYKFESLPKGFSLENNLLFKSYHNSNKVQDDILSSICKLFSWAMNL